MAIPNEPDPIGLFNAWLAEAEAHDAIKEPTAMTLATVDEHNAPAARTVLLKRVSDDGFAFFTNLNSAKGRQLAVNPNAALCFYWMPLDKQIRVTGQVEPVSDEEADAYFATRPKQSQIGAWASKQSQPLTERLEFEKRIAAIGAKYALGAVPRPDFWSGFNLRPKQIEFWLKMPYRLHDRVLYTREKGAWLRTRLYP